VQRWGVSNRAKKALLEVGSVVDSKGERGEDQQTRSPPKEAAKGQQKGKSGGKKKSAKTSLPPLA